MTRPDMKPYPKVLKLSSFVSNDGGPESCSASACKIWFMKGSGSLNESMLLLVLFGVTSIIGVGLEVRELLLVLTIISLGISFCELKVERTLP